MADLHAFVRENWFRVSRNPFVEGEDTIELCRTLEQSLAPNARETFIGQRVGKTVIGSIMFPVWVWMQDPSIRILVVQHRIDFANAMTAKFGELAAEFRIPMTGPEPSMQRNSKGGFRATASPWRVPSIQVDLLILDDAFHNCPPRRAAAQRDYLLCRLGVGGRVVTLEG